MRRARVLVVDDPKRALSAALDRALLRHQVDAAHSALDAIYRIDCARLPYDVVLCDVVRGDLPGPELWAFLSINRKRAAERMVFVASTPLAPEARAFLDRVANPCVWLPTDAGAFDAFVGRRASGASFFRATSNGAEYRVAEGAR
jgi:CheY-like chemotaxis protein